MSARLPDAEGEPIERASVDLRTYVGILTKHWLLILLTTIASTGIAMAVYFRTPPTYAATVQFYVSTPLPEGTNAQSAAQFAQGRVNSYVEIMSSEELAKRIITATGVSLTPGQVASRVQATADVSTVLMTATVTDTVPERAKLIAQGVALTFGRLVDDLDNQGRKDALVVINIVSGPTLKPAPVAPDLRLHLLLGVLVGLVGGAGYSVLREVLSTSIHSAGEAQQLLHLPVLGSIPRDSGARKGSLVLDERSLSLRAEAYRQVRTNLQFIDATQTADVILVTSAEPREGKSVTAINLALVLAELGRRTLLIDADMRKPMASEYLDVDNAIGLSNVLAGQVETDEAISEFGREHLLVLPSGSTPPNPSELLGSARMSSLLETLRPHFDHIVIDSPPVLPVTDAVVASAVVDAVVVVVAAGKTSRTAVQSAVASLRAVNAPLVGVLLNKTRQQGGPYYASYRAAPESTTTQSSTAAGGGADYATSTPRDLSGRRPAAQSEADPSAEAHTSESIRADQS